MKQKRANLKILLNEVLIYNVDCSTFKCFKNITGKNRNTIDITKVTERKHKEFQNICRTAKKKNDSPFKNVDI